MHEGDDPNVFPPHLNDENEGYDDVPPLISFEDEEEEEFGFPTVEYDFDWKPGDPLGQMTLESTRAPPHTIYPPDTIVHLIMNGVQELFCIRNLIQAGSMFQLPPGPVQFHPKFEVYFPDDHLDVICYNGCIPNSFCDYCRIVVKEDGKLTLPGNEYFTFPVGTRVGLAGMGDNRDYYFSFENAWTYDLPSTVVYDRDVNSIVFQPGVMYDLPPDGYYYQPLGELEGNVSVRHLLR